MPEIEDNLCRSESNVPTPSMATSPPKSQRPIVVGEIENTTKLRRSAIRHRNANGQLVRLARGAYVTPDAEWSPHRDLLAVALRSPGTPFCLLTALELLKIRGPASEVWIAIGHKARPPAVPDVPLKRVRCSEELLRQGLITQSVDNIAITVTCAARTVVDCFKARRRVGLDLAVEALRAVRRDRIATCDELWHFAVQSDMTSVMRPYLQSSE
jgi:predicted transcriptional regulator of viral defense system